jgi:predicted transcriptional regulator of viral defense system
MRSTEALRRLLTLGQPVVRTSEAIAVLGLAPSTARHQLLALSDDGLIRHLAHGLWAVAPDIDPFVVASWITNPQPSYVSFYSALRFHGMIQQLPRTVYVASTSGTATITTSLGVFSIHQISPRLFGGYAEDRGRRVATPEKALFDTLYLRRARGGRFRGLTEIEIPEGFSPAKVREWISMIGDRRLRDEASKSLERVLGSAGG